MSEEGLATLREIALRISLGLSEDEVAEQLGIPKWLVQRRLRRLRDELDSESATGLITLAEAAKVVGMSNSHLYGKAKRGAAPALVRVDGRLSMRETEFDQWRANLKPGDLRSGR